MPAQTLDEEEDKLIGETLANRYQIEARLGEGAMGAVYRARHIKVGRPFAVKVLHSRLLEDKKVLQRFEREAELAGRLRHPNVIGVVDVGETANGLRYMVMDFAEGSDLASVLDEAPMPPHRVIHLTRQLLEGLYHAHEAGMIHRDFKPENVIIERDTHGAEVPRIVDFGIAILREGGESPDSPGRLTTNGLVLGTPHYMAPEQAVADPIDHRIDLFAMGIIVYEMLSGKLPFEGSGAEVARANLLLDPPPIAQRVPYLEVDPLLEAFARRLMSKKRDLRPATAKLARELLDLIDRDREAAAAALGVPLDASRPAMDTQPIAPRHVAHGGNDTYPPPLTRDALKTPPQAPALQNKLAILAAPTAHQKAISTEMAEPLTYRKRRWPLLMAAIVAVAALGVGGYIMLGDRQDATKAPEPVAVATPEIKQSEVPVPVVTPIAPPPVETRPPVEPPPVETKPAEPPPVETKPATPPTSDAKVIKHGPHTRPVETRPAEPKHAVPQVVETMPAETKPAPPPPPVETRPSEPAVAGPLDAKAFTARFKSVGAELAALERSKGPDVAAPLWDRYRLIRFADAVSSQPKRDQAAAVLDALHKDVASRSR